MVLLVVYIPDQVLTLPGFPQLACRSVDKTLAFFMPSDTSPDCETIQSLGSLCGCPEREDACVICPNGNQPGWPDNKLPFLYNLFLGSTPTCQILAACLKLRGTQDSLCFVSQFSLVITVGVVAAKFFMMRDIKIVRHLAHSVPVENKQVNLIRI